MRDSIDPRRLTRVPRACVLASIALVSAVLLAGCGGSSPNPSISASNAASAGSATTARSSAADGARSGPLAFAECMRAHGVPNFPDPKPGGEFRVPTGNNPAAPAFQAAQSKCEKLVPGSGLPGSGPPPSAQTMEKLLRIARCMRQHGVPQFPDPQTSIPSNPLASGVREITDFDGAILLFPSTINMQAPAYRQALTACGAPPLGLPH
jgi:hypothetical protein